MELWAGSLAVQAATYAAPLVAMYLLRDATCFERGVKAKPSSIWRTENIATPEIAQESGYVTPNVNVVYGFGFMDLGPDPVILSAPDSGGRYYMIEVCDSGPTRLSGRRGVRLQGRDVRPGRAWLARRSAGQRQADRLPNPLDRAAAAHLRQGPGRPRSNRGL